MNMRLKHQFLISTLLFLSIANAQQVNGVYKINDLLKRINKPDTLYVINFWATWCKPCVEELASFDSLFISTKNKPVKVLLVNLNFVEEQYLKVNPFIKKNHILPECVLLDEINGNDFVDKIHPKWSGAIPATLFKKGNAVLFYEKKLHLDELEKNCNDLMD